MKLKKILEQKRNAIVKKWFELVVKTYAPDAAHFIKKQPDQFTNPIGSTLSKGLANLFDQLLTGPDAATIKKHLDPIIRIRAVQNYTPSQAVAFIYILKNIIRDSLKKELADSRTTDELLQFESKIDSLVLAAFDIYMECREKIYELKTNVEKNKIYKAFERAGLITETPENGPGLQ
jgi:hypothetical protein